MRKKDQPTGSSLVKKDHPVIINHNNPGVTIGQPVELTAEQAQQLLPLDLDRALLEQLHGQLQELTTAVNTLSDDTHTRCHNIAVSLVELKKEWTLVIEQGKDTPVETNFTKLANVINDIQRRLYKQETEYDLNPILGRLDNLEKAFHHTVNSVEFGTLKMEVENVVRAHNKLVEQVKPENFGPVRVMAQEWQVEVSGLNVRLDRLEGSLKQLRQVGMLQNPLEGRDSIYTAFVEWCTAHSLVSEDVKQLVADILMRMVD